VERDEFEPSVPFVQSLRYKRSNLPGYRAFVGYEALMIARMECSRPQDGVFIAHRTCAPRQQSTQLSSLAPNARDYLLPRAVDL
jgi:hypothetical protein